MCVPPSKAKMKLHQGLVVGVSVAAAPSTHGGRGSERPSRGAVACAAPEEDEAQPRGRPARTPSQRSPAQEGPPGARPGHANTPAGSSAQSRTRGHSPAPRASGCPPKGWARHLFTPQNSPGQNSYLLPAPVYGQVWVGVRCLWDARDRAGFSHRGPRTWMQTK